MKELDKDYWRKLDAELLDAEAKLAEEKAWAEHDVFEGIGQTMISETVVIESPLL